MFHDIKDGENMECEGLDVIEQMNKIVKELKELGEIEALGDFYQETLAFFDSCFEKTDDINILFLCDLIETKLTLGDYESADMLVEDLENRVFFEPVNQKVYIKYYSLLSNYYYKKACYQKALECIELSYQTAVTYYQRTDKEFISLVLEYVRSLCENENYDYSLQIINEQIKYIDKNQYHETYLFYLNALINLYEKKGNFKKAKEYIYMLYSEVQIEQNTSINNEMIIIECADHLIKVHEFTQAREMLVDCLQRALITNNKVLKIKIFEKLAELFRIIGEKENERFYREEIYETALDIYKYDSEDMLNATLGLASIYAEDNKLEEAVQLYESVYEKCVHIYGEDSIVAYKVLYVLNECKNLLHPLDSYPDNVFDLLSKIQPLDEELYMEFLFRTISTFINQNYSTDYIIQVVNNHLNEYYNETTMPVEYLIAFAHYLHESCRDEQARYYALKGYQAVKNTEDIFKSLYISACYTMILCGYHEIEYIKEYFDLCKNEILVLYSNPDVGERIAQTEVLKKVYAIYKSIAKCEDYNELLRYKNILFDMEYYYNHSLNDEEKMELLTFDHLVKEDLSIDMNEYHFLYEDVMNVQGIKSLLYDNLLEQIQGELDDDECILDFYTSDKVKVFVITNKDLKSYEIEGVETLRNLDLDQYSHIYLCPDGVVYNYKFEEVLKQRVSYLSSPKFMLYKNGCSSLGSIELIGDIDYDATYKAINRDNYNTLVFSSYEINKIKDMFENVHVHTRIVTKEDFMSINQPYILHVSGHGMYIEEKQMLDRGTILLSNNEKVTARDILFMNFTGTSLVSLASCYSGKGNSVDFEGIYGLRRSFELAGARSLLLVKEEINDMIAAAFMTYFYGFYKTMSGLDAFYKAKEKMLELSLEEFDRLFSLDEQTIKENKLGFFRKELYRILEDKDLLSKELNKFIIQGYVK